jgi:hypothetical protein
MLHSGKTIPEGQLETSEPFSKGLDLKQLSMLK